MATDQITFDDGAAYERYMGVWSRLAGESFIDWLAPKAALRWLDVGCGNGAFTQLVVDRCSPAAIDGIDPSEAQLAYARSQPALRMAKFHHGDAMALPFADNSFDAAVMPLVIFFVPEPTKGVAEMARVVSPGGTVAAYAWDIPGGGFPYESLRGEIRAMGLTVPEAPRIDASRLDAMHDLWTAAGLVGVETKAITVQRTFADFDEYWSIVLRGPSVGSVLSKMSPEDLTRVKTKMRTILPTDGSGRITYSGRANAVKGRRV